MSLAVLSPHLDDAVLSLGAMLAASDEPVRVITVLAGDPSAGRPAGAWDAESGAITAGQAAARRREEDRRACDSLGVEPVWFPYGDEQYGRGAEDDEIWAVLHPAIGEATTVLAPGFPLRHADHKWLHDLVRRSRDRAWKLGLYVEQPYALGRGDATLALDASGVSVPFVPVPAPWSARRAKRRACLDYSSQLGLLAARHDTDARGLVRRIQRHELRWGGERVAWLEDA